MEGQRKELFSLTSATLSALCGQRWEEGCSPVHPGDAASKVLFEAGTPAPGRDPSLVLPELSFPLVSRAVDAEGAESLMPLGLSHHGLVPVPARRL